MVLPPGEASVTLPHTFLGAPWLPGLPEQNPRPAWRLLPPPVTSAGHALPTAPWTRAQAPDGLPAAHSLHPGLCSNLRCHVIRAISVSTSTHPPFLVHFSLCVEHPTPHFCLPSASRTTALHQSRNFAESVSQHPGVRASVLLLCQFARLPYRSTHSRPNNRNAPSQPGGQSPGPGVGRASSSEAGEALPGPLTLAVSWQSLAPCLTIASPASALILTCCLPHMRVWVQISPFSRNQSHWIRTRPKWLHFHLISS